MKLTCFHSWSFSGRSDNSRIYQVVADYVHILPDNDSPQSSDVFAQIEKHITGMPRSLHNTVAHALMSEPQPSQIASSSEPPVLQTPVSSPAVSFGHILSCTIHSTLRIPLQKKRSVATTSNVKSDSPPKKGRGAGTSTRTTRSGAGRGKGKDDEDDSTVPDSMQVD